MIRDITLGQYYEKQSVIHALDPRVKLAFTVIYIAGLYIGKGIFSYLFAGIFLAVLIYLSKVPVRFMLRGLKSIVFLIILSSIFNLFFVPGTTLVSFWKIRITVEGIETAVMMTIRLIFLIMGSSLMTLTTKPSDLTDGLEKALSFLKIFHIPVHEIAMMMSIALRFIPILIEEVNIIMNAQKARGADFEHGKITEKAKAMIPLLVPLFVSAFRRAGDLAEAMEARCYHGGDGRTKLYPLRYKKQDGIAYLILLGYLVAMILIRIFLPKVWAI